MAPCLQSWGSRNPWSSAPLPSLLPSRRPTPRTSRGASIALVIAAVPADSYPCVRYTRLAAKNGEEKRKKLPFGRPCSATPQQQKLVAAAPTRRLRIATGTREACGTCSNCTKNTYLVMLILYCVGICASMCQTHALGKTASGPKKGTLHEKGEMQT